MKRIIILLVFGVLNSGCASMTVRSDMDNPKITRGIYPAVREDVQWLAGVGSKNYDPLLTGAEPIIISLAIIDMPLAVVMDTVLLPSDLLRDKSNKEELKSLMLEYFPDYKLKKNLGNDKKQKSYFVLIAPDGQMIEFNQYFSADIGQKQMTNPELNDLFKKQSIKITSSEIAIEVLKLIEALRLGHMGGSYRQYLAEHEENYWLVRMLDPNHAGGKLGWDWRFEVNVNSVLEKVVVKY